MGGATPSHVIFRSDLMKIKFIQNIREQLCMDLTIITQLYCQLYITCQLHVSAIIRLDTIIGENYTVHKRIQYNHQCWCK